MSFAFITKRLWRNPPWRRRARDGSRLLGARGERAAARYLKRCRHRILARNYRGGGGEIDLVACREGVLVFVEVKTRTSDRFQNLQDAVSPVQWRRVERAARAFLLRYAEKDPPYRFDLVTVLWPKRGSAVVEHMENAYQPRS